MFANGSGGISVEMAGAPAKDGDPTGPNQSGSTAGFMYIYPALAQECGDKCVVYNAFSTRYTAGFMYINPAPTQEWTDKCIFYNTFYTGLLLYLDLY